MKLNKEILTLALILGVSVSELQDTFSVFAADYKQEHSKVMEE